MKTLYILFLLNFHFSLTFCQMWNLTANEYNNSGALKVEEVSTKEEAKALAKMDIEKGIPFLFIQGGYSSYRYESDPVFERKYKVYYHNLGCTGGGNYEMIKVYNFEIFEFLTKKYRNEWRKEVRKDVEYFDVWEKNYLAKKVK